MKIERKKKLKKGSIELEIKEEPELASYEKLEICPRCKYKSMLNSEKAEFKYCINLNCCYFERKKDYIDALGES